MCRQGQGRQQAQAGLGRQHQQALFAAGGEDIRRPDVAEKFDAHHQADAGQALDHGELCQTGAQLDGALIDVRQKAVVHPVHDHIGTGADHRVAAEGGAVGACTHPGRDLFVHQHGTDGQAAAQTLGQGDDIRLEVVVLTAQEGAGAAHAGLHFVHDEDQVPVIAELADGLHVFRLQRHDAAFALHQLQHHGAGVAVHQFGQGFEAARRDVLEALVEGTEVVVEHLLPGGGQGSDGAAMEAVDQRDDHITALAVVVEAVFAGRLDGTLIGLGTGVAKEDLAHAGALAQLFGQLAAGGRVVEVGCVLQLVGLLGNGLGPVHITIAQTVDADAAGEVQILLAFGAFGIQAVALFQRNGIAVVGMQDIVVVPLDDFFGIHKFADLPFLYAKGSPTRRAVEPKRD